MFFFSPQKVTAAQRSVQPADPAADRENPAEKGRRSPRGWREM